MIELTSKTLPTLCKCAKNKNNRVLNFMYKKADGATELSRMVLGKDRGEAVKALRGILPDGCGKIYCTFS